MRASGACATALLAALALACAGVGGTGAPRAASSQPVALPPLAGPPGLPRTVVLVDIGGFGPARYTGDDGGMPVARALASAGVAASEVVPVAPAAALPASVSLVTGVQPWRHGVVSDLPLGDRGVRADATWHASQVAVPTVWQRVREGHGTVAALGWPAMDGADVEHLLVDAPAAGEGPWLERQRALATPGVWDRVLRLAPDLGPDAPPPARRDAILVGVACELLSADPPPSLLMLRLVAPGEALRQSGPGSAAARAAFAAADEQLRRLVECLRAAGRLEQSALVVAGDAVPLAVHTRIDPNVVLARAGLLTPTSGGSGVRSWTAVARSNGSSAFVYARGESDAVLARRALEEEARQSRAFRVVSAEQMLALGGDRAAWFGLQAEPGYCFDDATAGPPLRASRERAEAGSLVPEPDASPGLVIWGRGVRSSIRVRRMLQTDVAPTLAALLGLPFDSPDGRVLVGALEIVPAVSLGVEPGDAAEAPAGGR